MPTKSRASRPTASGSRWPSTTRRCQYLDLRSVKGKLDPATDVRRAESLSGLDSGQPTGRLSIRSRGDLGIFWQLADGTSTAQRLEAGNGRFTHSGVIRQPRIVSSLARPQGRTSRCGPFRFPTESRTLRSSPIPLSAQRGVFPRRALGGIHRIRPTERSGAGARYRVSLSNPFQPLAPNTGFQRAASIRCGPRPARNCSIQPAASSW